MNHTELSPMIAGATVERVVVRGTTLAVETLGEGPGVLLLHGFPQNRGIWRDVAPLLAAEGLRVIAPDLHGLGDSGEAASGYDAATQAADFFALLNQLGADSAHVVGTDLGVSAAFVMAATSPEKIRSLTLTEGLVGFLPGAEDFLRDGPPWWFGFHNAPGDLAEDLILGSEDRYVRFFLRGGSRRGVADDLTEAIVDGYRGRASLHAAFQHYRALSTNAAWIAEWVKGHTLTMPVLAVGGGSVGAVTGRQLKPFTTHLTQRLLPGAGHLTPIDEPEALARLIVDHAVAPS